MVLFTNLEMTHHHHHHHHCRLTGLGAIKRKRRKELPHTGSSHAPGIASPCRPGPNQGSWRALEDPSPTLAWIQSTTPKREDDHNRGKEIKADHAGIMFPEKEKKKLKNTLWDDKSIFKASPHG